VNNQYNSELVADLYGLDEPLDMAGNRALFPAVAAGDQAARRCMIEGNLTLVVAKVDSFLGAVPQLGYLRDDLTSAGFIGLVKAVNRVAAGKVRRNDGYITGYLTVAIRREISRAIDKEAGIYVPPRSRQAAHAKGEEIDPPVVTHEIPEVRRINQNGPEEVEVRDAIDGCCTCEAERTFLAMREAGHTYAEIASTIGKPPSSTYAMGEDLEARIHEKLASTR